MTALEHAAAATARHDAALVRRAPELLRAFNDLGVLAPVDVHAALVFGRLLDEDDERVLLAAALAARAPRLGHVYADLRTVHETVLGGEGEGADPVALPWPEAGPWVEAVAASDVVADRDRDRPLQRSGSRLYLDRYWRYEQQVLRELTRRSELPVLDLDPRRIVSELDSLFPRVVDGEAPDWPRVAATVAATRSLSVIAGGPGTGKTTTVTKVLALLASASADGPLPRVALAAPTGKAADRVAESLREGITGLAGAVPEPVLAWLAALEASTLHRLLGRRGGSSTRFLHDRSNPLPFDVVVVDETSMVSLGLMARLLDAVADRTRLVLLGDPDQLASVEAGTVLGDIVGPARERATMRPAATTTVERLSAQTLPAPAPPEAPAIGDAIVVLRRAHRFDDTSGIAALAAAIQTGDAGAVMTHLRGDTGVALVEVDEDEPDEGPLSVVRAAVTSVGAAVHAAAAAGRAEDALATLRRLRVLCAHRRGSAGVAGWVRRVERWLVEDVDGYRPTGRWYVGQPVLVTQNDDQMNLRNGDVGVVVPAEGGLVVAFPGRDGVRRLSPLRLEAAETVHAMTIHKSQGSQFDRAVVVLPNPTSRILTRELLYTAVTRARAHVTVVGSEAAIVAAVRRPVQRASGLRAALWDD